MFSNKILVDSKEAFELIDKLNQALSEFEEVQQSSDLFYQATEVTFPESGMLDAKKEILKFKQDANDYADSVLSRLQLLVTKMQKML